MTYVDSPNQDIEHLRLLGIFYYVTAGLTAMCSCIFLLLFGFTGVLFVGVASDPSVTNGPPPALGAIFAVLGIFATFVCLALGGLLAYTGYSLQTQRHYYLCFVMGILMCLHAPIGTILGVFTILILLRPTVKPLFGLPA
jgi:hypothetical protein